MSETTREDEDAFVKFHEHLGDCRQCRDSPFELCPVGQRLLRNAAMIAESGAQKCPPGR